MRTPIIGGNWKMNTAAASAAALAAGIADAISAEKLTARCDVAVIPPFVYIREVGHIIRARCPGIMLGAQDVYPGPDGAFTGEISLAMLKDCSVSIVLAGHSERRHVIGEPDELVNQKVRAILDAGLTCILCIGEKLAQREAGETDKVNLHQTIAGLKGVSADQMARVVIAYEPVWAIGTGRTASPADAQAAQHQIRQVLRDLYGPAIADATRIQYGGSAKPSNALDILSQPDVDGGLIGAASLNAADFTTVVRWATQAKAKPALR